MSEGKDVCIQVTNGRIYVDRDFKFEQHTPIQGMVKITDIKHGEVYWFNMDHIVWIGPYPK